MDALEQSLTTDIIDAGENLPAAPTTASLRALAEEVRVFLAKELAAGSFIPTCDSWIGGWDPAFSQKLAAHGWIGLTIPKRYGGGGGSQLQRLVITEELLAAGAPVAAHWVTERQIGPIFIALGTEQQREKFLPLIAQAKISFALGMSEPESGSDLASVRTRAEPTDGGWLVSGQKIWTTSAHRSDYAMVLCRTGPGERHAGLSQLIVDLHAPGVEIRTIPASIGDDEFNEVFFDEVFVPAGDVLGKIGNGWRQITTELGYERGGPERFMSNMPLVQQFVRVVPSDAMTETGVGEIIARLIGLRALAVSVAAASDQGHPLAQESALAKDAGSMFEQETVELLYRLGCPRDDRTLEQLMNRALVGAPTSTLRGGTTEILRGIIAKNLTTGTATRTSITWGRTGDDDIQLLADAVERFFSERCPPDLVAAIEAGTDPIELWSEVEELGFPLTSVPEDMGGSGGSLIDALTILRLVGRHGVPLPLAETMLAGWTLAEAGLSVPGGQLTLVSTRAEDQFTLNGHQISGRALRVPWASTAAQIVLVARDQNDRLQVVALEPAKTIVDPGVALTGEPRDRVELIDVSVPIVAVAPPSLSLDVIQTRATLMRSAMMLGALERASELTVTHACSRTQFGRPIARFQAVQQLIAQIAREVALTKAAVELAAQTVNADPLGGWLEVGAAKIVAGRAAGTVSTYAHQVHGAIGITKEYPLSALTRRLWTWRGEFGTEAEWSRRIGAKAWTTEGGPWKLATSSLVSPANAK
jgi:alkylation response protein AidB-like acyl-CoA dehydrogenase